MAKLTREEFDRFLSIARNCGESRVWLSDLSPGLSVAELWDKCNNGYWIWWVAYEAEQSADRYKRKYESPGPIAAACKALCDEIGISETRDVMFADAIKSRLTFEQFEAVVLDFLARYDALQAERGAA